MKKWTWIFIIALNACVPAGKIAQIPSPNVGEVAYVTVPEIAPASQTLDPLRITVINVGQGDATLIQTPGGKSLLIDGGNDGKGREVIVPFLQSQNITKLDAIVLTHYDADHMAGLDEVIEYYPPRLGVFDRGELPLDDSPFYPAYSQSAAPFRKAIQAGETISLDDALSIRCISANGRMEDGSASLIDGEFSQKENASSIALLIEYKNFRYFSGGDLTGGGAPGGFQTPDLETALAPRLGRISALHANHHGSLTSSHPDFVAQTHPQAVFFNVGDGNEYHHPAQEVLERWKNGGADLWLTEKGSGGFIVGEKVVNGNIALETDGIEMKVNEQNYSLHP